MKEVNGFVVSSARTCERNASSEVYYILTEELSQEKVDVKPTPAISGLSIATFKNNPVQLLKSIKELVEEEPSFFRYTLKLVPFQYRVKSSLDELKDVAKILGKKIKEENRWRITLRRRHTSLNRKEVIKTIANEIKKGIVNLENAEKIIIAEIIGKWTYLALSPIAELSLVNYRKEVVKDNFTF